MKMANVLLGTVALVMACADTDRQPGDGARDSVASSARNSGQQSWPANADEAQVGDLAELDVARFPICSSAPLTPSSDSIAFLRAGMTVTDLAQRCPAGVRLWDSSFEGVTEPVVVVRIGDVPVVATFHDTLPGSRAWVIRIGAKSVKTQAGIGVGSSIDDLLRAYGHDGEAYESECHVFAEFTAEPGIVWELSVSPDAECNELLPGQGTGLERVPPKAVVKELRQVGRD